MPEDLTGDELGELLAELASKVARRKFWDPPAPLATEDVAQAMAEHVYRKRDHFRGKPLAYVCKAMERAGTDVIRPFLRRVETTPLVEEGEVPAAPEGGGLGVEGMLDVRRAVAALDEDERLVIQGRFWDGRTVAEIAAVRGVSPATIKRTLGRGGSELRILLAHLQSVSDWG